MNRLENEPIVLVRDCDAILIPAGTRISLKQDSVVFVVQALGGNYTVNINGNLAQVNAKDADALGFEVLRSARSDTEGLKEDGSLDEEHVWEQMRTCYDPEIPINIVDLGLIYDFKMHRLAEGGYRIDIIMTLTAPGCGMGDFLAADVRYKIASIPNVKEVQVELTFDPPWNQDMMSAAARLQLGMY